MTEFQLKIPVKENIVTQDNSGPKVLVIAEKLLAKGFIHALAEGGGTIGFDGNQVFAVRIVPVDGTYNRIQLVCMGRQESLKSSLYWRPKAVKTATNNSKQPQLKQPLKEFEFKDGGVEEI